VFALGKRLFLDSRAYFVRAWRIIVPMTVWYAMTADGPGVKCCLGGLIAPPKRLVSMSYLTLIAEKVNVFIDYDEATERRKFCRDGCERGGCVLPLRRGTRRNRQQSPLNFLSVMLQTF